MKLPEKKEEWSVFVTQSTSVVRFLLSAKPKKIVPVNLSKESNVNRPLLIDGDTTNKELIRFVRTGMLDGWDKAATAVYGVETVDQLQDMWIQWLKSDESRKGLPNVSPPVAVDSARIPPVNLGK